MSELGTAVGELAVMSSIGMASVLSELKGQCERAAGGPFTPILDSSQALMARIKAGASADVAILTAEAIEELTGAGIIAAGSRVDLARSRIGVAVRPGAPRPDLSSADGFVRSLLAASSIAHSRSGASGIYFTRLIERLGIAEALKGKTTVVATGFVATHVVSGEVELGVQQISELMAVPGADIVGPLPADIQSVTIFSAGIFTMAKNPDAARALVGALTDPAAAAVIAAKGLEPC
jgi:molybdate transport system substrate-binding protein